MSYTAAGHRYDSVRDLRCGPSRLGLPPISLGLWHNLGADRPLQDAHGVLFRAFDLGITHFDLANSKEKK